MFPLYVLAFSLTPLMAFLNRLRGGLSVGFTVPGNLRKLLVALPFGAVACIVAAVAGWPIIAGVLASLLVLAATYGAITLGHGEQSDIGKSDYEAPNDIDDVVAWFYRLVGKEVDYDDPVFEGIGLGLTGFLQTLPLGVMVTFVSPAIGIPLMLSGWVKWPAYAIGHAVGFKIPGITEATDARGRNPDFGELLFGTALGLQLGLVLLARGGL